MRKDDYLIIEALQNNRSGGPDVSSAEFKKKQAAWAQGAQQDLGWHPDTSNMSVDELKKHIVDLSNALETLNRLGAIPTEMRTALNQKVNGRIQMLQSDAKHKEEGEENAEDTAEDKMRDRENAADEKQRDAEVSAAFHYDPMPGLEKTANKVRDLLQGAANDEARTEHIIKMAQTILGSPKDYNPNEYRKMLDGLIVTLNRFIVVPMNEYEEDGASEARRVANNAVTAAWDHMAGI